MKIELEGIAISRITKVFTKVSIFSFGYNTNLLELSPKNNVGASDPVMTMNYPGDYPARTD